MTEPKQDDVLAMPRTDVVELVHGLIAGRGTGPGGEDLLVMEINGKVFAFSLEAAEALVSGARELLDRMGADRRRRSS